MSDEAFIENIRSDINGLGGRITGIELKHERCAGTTGERLRYVESECDKKEDEITRIFQSQEKINIQLEQLKTILKLWGVIASVVAPIVAAFVGAIVAKMF